MEKAARRPAKRMVFTRSNGGAQRTKAAQTSPTTAQDLYDQIQKKAYELYEARGYSHGNHENDWYEAERIVLSERAA